MSWINILNRLTALKMYDTNSFKLDPEKCLLWIQSTSMAKLNEATSLISQASLQTTYHECSPYAELTAFVSNSWIDIENVNNIVQYYKKAM